MAWIWWSLIILLLMSVAGKAVADVEEFKEEEEKGRARRKRIDKMYGRDGE